MGQRQGRVLTHTLAVLVIQGTQQSKGHPGAGVGTRVGDRRTTTKADTKMSECPSFGNNEASLLDSSARL